MCLDVVGVVIVTLFTTVSGCDAFLFGLLKSAREPQLSQQQFQQWFQAKHSHNLKYLHPMVSCGFAPVLVWLCLVRPCFSSQVSGRGDGCDWSDSGRSVPCTRCRQRPWQASAAMICNGHIKIMKSNEISIDFWLNVGRHTFLHISIHFYTHFWHVHHFALKHDETWLQAPQFAPPLSRWSRWCVVDVVVWFRIAGLEPEAMHCAYVLCVHVELCRTMYNCTITVSCYTDILYLLCIGSIRWFPRLILLHMRII